MARKRKSSEMEPSPRESIPVRVPEPKAVPEGVRVPEAERGIGHGPNAKELDEQLARFCGDAHLRWPRATPHPPPSPDIEKLYKRLDQLYRFLYFRNPLQLQRAEASFFRSLLGTPNSQTSEKARLELINERLEDVRTTTPHRGTAKHSVLPTPRPPRSLPTVDESARPDPPSPTRTTRAANIATSSQTEAHVKQTANAQSRKALSAAPSSSRHADPPPIKNHFAVTKKALLEAKSAPVDTSFATDATKSFGAPPIFTQSTQSGSQLTAATDLTSDDENYYSAKQTGSEAEVGSDQTTDSEEDRKRESTHYCSSLAPSEARSLIAAVQKLESSQDTVRRIPRASHAPSTSPRSSQLWGSSIDTSQADFLQARADILLADADACLTDQPGYTIDGRASSSKRPRLEQNRQLITPSDDEVEQQPVFRPLPKLTTQRFSPAKDFAQLKIPASFTELSFELQWEAQRVLQAGILSPEQLDKQCYPRNLETLYTLASVSGKPFTQGFSADQSTNWEKATLNAKLEYAKSRSGSLFDLALQPPNRGDDCALQRKIGNQNVLYVDIPNLNKPPVELKGKNLNKRFYDMALQFQHFLGRKWFLYLTQAHKRKKKVDPEATKLGTCRLMFLAVDNGFSMTDVLSCVIPYDYNSQQAARKVYSRLELAASSTTPVFTFACEDVQIVGDQLASTDAADNTFLDPALASRFYEPQVSNRVMNDGCCDIHPWVMWKATLALGGGTDLKTALQARFGLGMAKGIWYRWPGPPPPSSDVKPPGPLIRISSSQIKVKHGPLRDLDSHGLTLNVVKANSDVRPSILHIGFLSILVDRGVPKQDLIELVREQIHNDMDELETALKSPSPMPLRHWMHRRHELWEERNRTGDISKVAGFPVSREERIVQMLESGLVPSQEAFLASEVRTMVKTVLDTKKKNFKIPLSRSTTLLGVALADPLNCLAPGEIHVNFARTFCDKITGMPWSILHEMECLIARNPAMAPWDMQKVKAVFKPELAHLPNVVILSAKGKRPLAELLQGGDYDGDTFWLCWEPRLVRPFRNHPAPWDPPPIDFFGIKKDPKLLCDYVKQPRSDSQWLKWLADMAETRMRFNLLGVVTKLHERLIYLEGGIRSRKALYLVHLHDYLVDADKQGYDFAMSDLEEFKKKIKLPTNLPTPAHWEFTKVDTSDDEDVYPVHDFKIKGNIIDDVFYQVIHPMAEASLSRVQDILRPAADAEDLSLAKFYNETFLSAANDDDMATSSGQILAPREARDLIKKELKALRDRLSEVRDLWITQQKKHTFNELILQLRKKYESIMPTTAGDPTVFEWLRKQGNDLTIWEKLRASAFAKFHYKTSTPGRLVWHVAHRELCLLKAHECCSQTRTLTTEAWTSLRPRKELKTIEVDDDEAPANIEANYDDCVSNEYY